MIHLAALVGGLFKNLKYNLDFWVRIELLDSNKHLMAGPKGKYLILFPKNLNSPRETFAVTVVISEHLRVTGHCYPV